MKAANRFQNPTTAVNQFWQTDFTYLKVIGWGWYFLSTVLDDYSRYILAWKLCSTMKATDVQDALNLALQTAGYSQVSVRHMPRLLGDNGPSYISRELGQWLDDRGMGCKYYRYNSLVCEDVIRLIRCFAEGRLTRLCAKNLRSNPESIILQAVNLRQYPTLLIKFIAETGIKIRLIIIRINISPRHDT